MKDGSTRLFMQERRPGGSYTNKLTHEGNFVIVEDAWGKKTMLPSSDILEIHEMPEARF